MGFIGNVMQSGAARRAASKEAEIIERETRLTVAAMRKSADRQIANMEATVAAKGIELSGTALDIVNQNASELEQEALDVARLGADAAGFAHARARAAGKAAALTGFTGAARLVASTATFGQSLGG